MHVWRGVCHIKMESRSSRVRADKWTQEETDGDNRDDATRLMDGSEIASIIEGGSV